MMASASWLLAPFFAESMCLLFGHSAVKCKLGIHCTSKGVRDTFIKIFRQAPSADFKSNPFTPVMLLGEGRWGTS